MLTWASQHPVFRIHYTIARVLNNEAGVGFGVLGARATNAVPELVKIFDANISPESRLRTMEVLGHMGPAAKAAIPDLLRAATGVVQDRRNNALWALSQIHADPDKVVPVLIISLRDPLAVNRAIAADGLAAFGSNAKPAISPLVALLNDPNLNSNSDQTPLRFPAPVRTKVEEAIRKIDPETYARVVTNAVPAAAR